MCGIFGIISIVEDAHQVQRAQADWTSLMESSISRGKDSSGSIFFDYQQKRIEVIKGNVSIAELKKDNRWKSAWERGRRGNRFLAMGHTRLVTNGSQMENQNNQPVILDNQFLLHNGIVVNHEKLWSDHPQLHRSFEIDSEIILALIQANLDQGIDVAVKEANAKLQGTYSYACLLPNYGKLILSSNNGSLFVFKNNHVIAFASERIFLERLSLVHGTGDIQQIKDGNSLEIPICRENEIGSFEVVLSEVEAAWSERSAYGDEVPSPKFPVVGLKRKVEVPAAPKRTVDDAVSPPKKEIMVVVELVVVPNEVSATVYGKPKV